jgi:hypothetical protein
VAHVPEAGTDSLQLAVILENLSPIINIKSSFFPKLTWATVHRKKFKYLSNLRELNYISKDLVRKAQSQK